MCHETKANQTLTKGISLTYYLPIAKKKFRDLYFEVSN